MGTFVSLLQYDNDQEESAEVVKGCSRTISCNRFINQIDFCNRKDRIISASDDRSLKVWQIKGASKVITRLQAHRGPVFCVKTSKSGKLIASGGSDCTVQIWNSDSYEHITGIKGHIDSVWSLCFGHDEDIIISGGGDNNILISQISTSKVLTTINSHTQSVLSLALHPTQPQLLSGSDDFHVKIFDITTLDSPQQVAVLDDHSAAVRGIVYTPVGDRFVTCSEDSSVAVWCSVSFCKVMTFQAHLLSIRCLAVTPDGQQLVTGGSDRVINVWRLATGEKLFSLEGHEWYVNSLAVSKDGKQIISGGFDRRIRVWNVKNRLIWPVLFMKYQKDCKDLVLRRLPFSLFRETLEF